MLPVWIMIMVLGAVPYLFVYSFGMSVFELPLLFKLLYLVPPLLILPLPILAFYSVFKGKRYSGECSVGRGYLFIRDRKRGSIITVKPKRIKKETNTSLYLVGTRWRVFRLNFDEAENCRIFYNRLHDLGISEIK
jgi:hypothetical protein